jgi:hypothetical protein
LRAEIVPTGAIVLAVLVALGAYGTASRDRAARSPRNDAEPRESARFDDTFPAELGPEGLQWQWMKGRAQLVVHGQGRYWVAFKALSFRRARRLSLMIPHHELVVRVTTAPTAKIMGPLVISGTQQFALRARPGPRRHRGLDKRRLAIFLSSPILARDPVAALLGLGFMRREIDANGLPFNWLGQNGHLELISRPPARRVWLSFAAMSLRRRLLTLRRLGSGRAIGRVEIPGDGVEHIITFGPVSLVNGRSSLFMRASPGPEHNGPDPRALSVRIARLHVETGKGHRRQNPSK